MIDFEFKYSSSLSSPFPAKHKWTAEQAQQYLVGHQTHRMGGDLSSKRKPKSAMLNQEQAENPPRERCKNVLRMLKLDAKLEKLVSEYTDEIRSELEPKQRANLVELHRVKKLGEIINEMSLGFEQRQLLILRETAEKQLDLKRL